MATVKQFRESAFQKIKYSVKSLNLIIKTEKAIVHVWRVDISNQFKYKFQSIYCNNIVFISFLQVSARSICDQSNCFIADVI